MGAPSSSTPPLLKGTFRPSTRRSGSRSAFGGGAARRGPKSGTPSPVSSATCVSGPRDLGARPEAYLHFTSTYWPLLSFVIKAQGDPAEYAASIRTLIARVDPAQVVESIRPLDEEIHHAVSAERVQTSALGALSGLALLLAVIGLYGLLSSSVTQRMREFGIRLALGARPRQILWSALRPGLVLTAVGAALGLAAALLGGRVLEGLLFETRATDLTSILGAAGVLALVALVVSLLPARRGARVDPALSLRHE